MKISDAEIISAYELHGSVWKAGAAVGMCGQSVHYRLSRIGANTPMRTFTEDEKSLLLRDYEAWVAAGRLPELAAKMGRTKQFVCRQARALGLTDASRNKTESTCEKLAIRSKAWLSSNPHPRGNLGHKASDETREKLSVASKKFWGSMSKEKRSEISLRQQKAKVEKHGSLALVPRPSASWKASWKEIGGVRRYYRSSWEANYAFYLEWLKGRGEISSWKHEPKTFWFEKVKRGVRSYLPDFEVTENNGRIVYHEVKGWMDDRSKTKIRRMAKYYPEIKLIVVDAKAYAKMRKVLSGIVPGWE